MISGDTLDKIRGILRAIQADEDALNKLNLNDDELQELIDYLGRIIINWRICD